MIAIGRSHPASGVHKVSNAFQGQRQGRDRYEADHCSGDEQHIVQRDVNPLSHDKADGTNAQGVDSRPTYAVNGAGGNRAQTKEICFAIADVDGSTSVQEKGCDGWINNCWGSLIGCLVCDSSEVNRLGVGTPIDGSV